MQRIIMFEQLNDEDIQKIESLFLNEDFKIEISKYSKSLTIHGNKDTLAYVKRTLLTNGFQII